MFETSVMQARAQAARGRFSLLTLSIFAHTAVVVGAIAASIASTEFPAHAPDQFELAPDFRPVTPPPPLGNGPAAAARPAQPKTEQPQQARMVPPAQPVQDAAPSVVPETIAVNEVPLGGTPGTGTGPSTSAGPGPGVPWGTPSGTGDLDAPPGPATTVEPEPERIYEAFEVKAPVPVYKPDPRYPSHLVRTRMPATVIVRCIIDKNGRVRDAKITRGAMPPFNQAVLNAIANWRYTPGSRNGIAVETYLNVTVTFAVN